jgi:hypothetical protein
MASDSTGFVSSEGKSLTDITISLRRDIVLLDAQLALVLATPLLAGSLRLEVVNQLSQVEQGLECVRDAVGLSVAEDLEASIKTAGDC